MRLGRLSVGLAILLCGVLAIASGLGVFAAPPATVLRSAPVSEPLPARSESGGPAVAASLPVQEPAVQALERSSVRMLELPDGSQVMPLNGVTAPAEMVWGEVPWSPIVRTTGLDGTDWYVHEDGTHSTTLMVYRSDLGRKDPVTLISRSASPAPVENAAGPAVRVGGPGQRR